MNSLASGIQEIHSSVMSGFNSDPLDYFKSPQMKGKVTPEFLRCMSLAGVSYSVIVTSIITLTTVFMTLPALSKDDHGYWFRFLIVTFLTGNIAANFIFVGVKRSFYNGNQGGAIHGLPSVSWKKCIDCQHNMPPRTHHCPLCQRCILRRDHHCFFTGCCVGFENHRYFLMFCLYCGLGSFYAFYHMYSYMNLGYSHTENMSFIHYFLPFAMLECIFGYMTLHLFHCIFVSYLSIFSGFGSLGIFCWQFFLAALGTTTHEFHQQRWTFKCGLFQNLRQVFGPWWAFNLICPMPWLKTPGNGMDWDMDKKI